MNDDTKKTTNSALVIRFFIPQKLEEVELVDDGLIDRCHRRNVAALNEQLPTLVNIEVGTFADFYFLPLHLLLVVADALYELADLGLQQILVVLGVGRFQFH